MTLFWQEIKKIAQPGVLAVLAVLGTLYFYLFPSFQVEYFSNGENAQILFDYAWDWKEQYGTTLEPEERAELDAVLAAEITRFDESITAAIQQEKESVQDWLSDTQMEAFLGDQYEDWIENLTNKLHVLETLPVTDYASFLTARQDIDRRMDAREPQAQEEHDAIMDLARRTNFLTIQTLGNFLEAYDRSEVSPASQSESLQAAPAAVQARVQTLETQERGYLPHSVVQSTMEYSQRLGVWVVLSVVLLLSPTLVRDRLHRMRALQWSARRGRNVLRVQLAAALSAALFLTVCNLIAYAIPLFGRGPLHFQSFSLYNRYSGLIPWFDWNYGGYLLVLAVMELALGLAAGAVTVFLSQYSGNYVAMLLKAVPLFLALGLCFAPWVLDWAFFLRPLGEQRYLPRGLEFGCMAVLLALGGGLCAQALRRQGRRELLS